MWSFLWFIELTKAAERRGDTAGCDSGSEEAVEGWAGLE